MPKKRNVLIKIKTEKERKAILPKLKKTKRMKPVKAWAVLFADEYAGMPFTLDLWGNGNEFQYPVFGSKKEAIMWWERMNYGLKFRIIRVSIEEI